MKNENILGHLVDKLAQVKAKIADLKIDEQALRQELIDSGETSIEGVYHRAAISLPLEGKTTIDWQTVAMHFKPSRQLIKAHTSQGEAYATVRVSARKSA
jgi:hypothetical protein